MAAVLAPARVSSRHQSMLRFVGKAGWSDDRLLETAFRHAIGPIESQGAVDAWILDDTGMPKKGCHSVGVARQWCGATGKQDDCQVAVALSVGNGTASIPVGYRLYLPKARAGNQERRSKSGVPEAVACEEKGSLG